MSWGCLSGILDGKERTVDEGAVGSGACPWVMRRLMTVNERDRKTAEVMKGVLEIFQEFLTARKRMVDEGAVGSGACLRRRGGQDVLEASQEFLGGEEKASAGDEVVDDSN
jgi:hypothetical protein